MAATITRLRPRRKFLALLVRLGVIACERSPQLRLGSWRDAPLRRLLTLRTERVARTEGRPSKPGTDRSELAFGSLWRLKMNLNDAKRSALQCFGRSLKLSPGLSGDRSDSLPGDERLMDTGEPSGDIHCN